jgi:hypothetical protein
MPQLTVEKTRTLCPPGLHVFELKEVSTITMQSFDGTGQVERLLWRFVSSKRDPEGAFFEVPVFTGYSYGNPKAKLTWLLDMLRPGISKREADNLDTDRLVGERYEGSVKHATSERDPDKKVATFAYLRPVDAPPDPFVDDNTGAVEPEPAGIAEVGEASCDWKGCEEMLTLTEIQASMQRFGKKRFCQTHFQDMLELTDARQ